MNRYNMNEYSYDDMLEEYYEGRDFLTEADGDFEANRVNEKIYKGDDTMIDKVADIIRKYKDVELITVPEYSDKMEFELYDFLDKPGNFEEDIECILFEIQPVIPTTYTVSHKYCNDEYWDGEEMVESNLSCTITVEYKGDNQ